MEHRKLEVTPIESIVDKMQVLQLLNNIRGYILSLPRWNNHSKYDNPYMLESNDGKYIRLEDALKLFGAENE